MATDPIDWNQSRRVFKDSETEEYYIKVEGGYMLDYDYVNGGQVIIPALAPKTLTEVGRYTNAQIQQETYVEEKK